MSIPQRVYLWHQPESQSFCITFRCYPYSWWIFFLRSLLLNKFKTIQRKKLLNTECVTTIIEIIFVPKPQPVIHHAEILEEMNRIEKLT